MFIDFLLEGFENNHNKDAIVWKNNIYSYQWLLERVHFWLETLKSENIKQSTVSIVEGDFSPNSIALFLALIEHGCIIVPLTLSVEAKKEEFIEIAQGEILFKINNNDIITITRLSNTADHDFYQLLKKKFEPGLILFSSGTTGKSKAALHNLVNILEKFKARRHSLRTITFLLYDHIGGVNTMFYTLSNAGCIITVQDRSPDNVLQTVEKFQVELVPTSPTFINLILMSEAYKRWNLKSLKTVTYGTEPMPESTLRRFHELFPQIRLLQTYGLSEVGILRSKSKNDASLWVKIGGEGFQTRIVKGVLQIKGQSTMLGYLNAPSPFTKDGWFNTGDAVEVDGEYIKILGRLSEIINVGGEKVSPTEVESVIQELENVKEVTVYGEKNPIMGNIVCAKITIEANESPKRLKARVKLNCYEKLSDHQVPMKIKIIKTKQHSERFKKIRAQTAKV